MDRVLCMKLLKIQKSFFASAKVPFKNTLEKLPKKISFSNIDISDFPQPIELKFLENIFVTNVKLFYRFLKYEFSWVPFWTRSNVVLKIGFYNRFFSFQN